MRTYTRDSFTGLDYADQRFYASSLGRFNTADPFRPSADAKLPGSWNRYAYVVGDPIRFIDPRGLNKKDETGYCSPEYSYEDCIDIEIPSGGGGDGGGGGGEGQTVEKCDNPATLSSDQFLGVAVILGENSSFKLGKAAYVPGDSQGHPSGPTITWDTIKQEDLDFASVLKNRIGGRWGNSITEVVGLHAGEYNTLAGLAKLTTVAFLDADSAMCKDFRTALGAMNTVLSTGSVLQSGYLYWKAVDQGRIGFHKYNAGDIYVGNTAFGTVN